VRALEAAGGLKAGTWESVEALCVLAIETKDMPDGAMMLTSARSVASGLKAGTWESVRALAWLARADRECGVR
jgi:hypothetical protein